LAIYKDAEFTARDRLHALKRKKMSFAHYVDAFDDCYAHIPEFEEARRQNPPLLAGSASRDLGQSEI
jgi:hypothetical protein